MAGGARGAAVMAVTVAPAVGLGGCGGAPPSPGPTTGPAPPPPTATAAPATGPAQPPSTFRPGGIRPGPQALNTYLLIYGSEPVARDLKLGADAAPAFDSAHDSSLTVIA